jgi:hypothetical protein
MKAIGFKLQEVVNPNTQEQSKRIAVAFDNGKVIKLWNGDVSIEDTVAAIKADKPAHIAKVCVLDGEFGQYCVFSRANTIEEF